MTSIGHVGFEKILENVMKYQTESELGEILKVNIDLCQIYMFKRGTCIKGLFWPPLEPKTESCLSPISSYWVIRRIAQV